MVNLLKKNRLAACLICLLLSCSFIASCENVSLPADNLSSATSSSVAIPDESSPVDEVDPSLKYVGGEFTIAVTSEREHSFTSDPNTDDIIGIASVSRYEKLLDKCGIELKYKVVNADTVAAEIEESKKAGLPYADILCLPAKTLSSLADSGYLYNLLTFSDFNIDEKYINTEAVKSIIGNNTLYMHFDNSTQFYDETWVVFYDKQLVSNAGLSDPATVVKDGKWTWDEFMKYSEAVAQKVMSKGSPDTATDIFGYSSYNGTTELPLAIWESCGFKLFGNTYGYPVTFKTNLSDINKHAKALQGIYANKSRLSLQGEEAVNAFKNGRVGFFIYKLGFSSALAQSGRDWGILPLPKYTAEQTTYNSFVDPSAYALAIPVNATDPQKSLLALNMLCATSHESMKKALYDKYVNLYFTNNTSTVMLDMIMDSSYFDFAAIYASGMPKVADISTNIIVDFISKKGSEFIFTANTKTAFEKYTAEKFK
jgi:hypothetical protein